MTAYSNGQLEGHRNQVKVLKRLGHCRAKLDLSRQRILHRVVALALPLKARRMDLVSEVA